MPTLRQTSLRAASHPRWAAVLLVLAALPVQPQTAMPRHAQACAACHGASGVSLQADVPNLAGQKSLYLESQLKAFRDGTRKNELMAAVAAPLSDDDVRQLASWWSAQPAGGAALAQPSVVESSVGLPADFPAGFREYLRVTKEAHKTIDIAYANAVAWRAARAGQALPEGSVIVMRIHAAERSADGTWAPAALRATTVMERRAGWGEAVPELLRNADWHYGWYTPQGQSRMGNQHARCLACHKPLAERSFVFTLEALRKAALGGS
jgi:cytochrome c553